MIHKTLSPKAGHIRIVFELPSSIWANQIFLTGDFNNWHETSIPMKQERDGIWRTSLDLLAGQSYEFRYLVDGEWVTDFHADGFSSNIFGTQNSIVEGEFRQFQFTVVDKANKSNISVVERSLQFASLFHKVTGWPILAKGRPSILRQLNKSECSEREHLHPPCETAS